jgi:protocatechuate 3,4-dioxygenase beta subunit
MNSFASPRLLICCLLLISAANAFSQSNTISIKGTITDQLGGLVVGATLIARDTRGNAVTVTSDTDGDYAFHNLLPGRYDLTVTGQRLLDAGSEEPGGEIG